MQYHTTGLHPFGWLWRRVTRSAVRSVLIVDDRRTRDGVPYRAWVTERFTLKGWTR